MNMTFKRKLPIPQDIKAMYPALEKDLEIRKQNVEEVKDIIAGKSDNGGKLMVLVPLHFQNHAGIPANALRDKRSIDSSQQGGDGT